MLTQTLDSLKRILRCEIEMFQSQILSVARMGYGNLLPFAFERIRDEKGKVA